MPNRQVCQFAGCDKFVASNGLCGSHSAQRRRGVELRPIRAPRPKPIPGMLWCGRCRQYCDESDFGWDPTRDAPKRTCKPCNANGGRERADIGDNRERGNHAHRLWTHGITQDDYDTMLRVQNDACAICDRTDRKLEIDHSHKHGHVRGLLCGPCNRAIAFLADNVKTLQSAIDYLRRTDRVDHMSDDPAQGAWP